MSPPPTSRSNRSPTGSASPSARSHSRSATPPATPPRACPSSCARRPPPSRGPSSPATPSSSATSADPTCSPPSDAARGSINVGLDGRFAEYAGDIVRPGQRIVLLGDAGRGTEAKVRLARIGFDAVAGEVPDIEAILASHPELATSARRLTAADVDRRIADEPDIQIVDVRNPGETKVGGTLPRARNLPLPQLLDHLDDLDPTQPTVVYCAGGYRSSVAASTLTAHGFTQVADLIGGYSAWLSHTTTHYQEA